ncbi:testis development-related protein-like [Sinocyclocheilus rhinocerous]|uniref:testis development-related protein-like n=1 Tax=Sinocyclocheilus rhinocerous TaxID=307959 RepID=UPI0007B9B332|nr:PREDICTED: testis development-related protein-like [Sinocyclocheilus rhinocerous]
MITIQSDEGPSAMTQLAKRMQGAGAKGWKSVSTLFTKDDEHQLLEADNQPAADHPLAVKPEEPPRPNKRSIGFWDSFATKWHQEAAMRQAEATEAGGDGSEEEVGNESGARTEDCDNQVGQEAEAGDSSMGNSFSKYATLGGGSEDTSAFKWNFVTSKLAELKTKSMAKSN